jgi:hypothetical protein
MIRTCASVGWVVALLAMLVTALVARGGETLVVAPMVAAFVFIAVTVLLAISVPALRITWHFLLARIADLSGAIRGERPDLDDP